ncbi:MAG: hypothetical protein IJ736_09745 [Firmicutes bacterium]|nr:hypothetical protein [Bacillota bacterium]
MKNIIYRQPWDWENCEDWCRERYVGWKDTYKTAGENSEMLMWTESGGRKIVTQCICSGCMEEARECLKYLIEINEIFLKKYDSKKHKKMSDEQKRQKILYIRANIEYYKWVMGENDIENVAKSDMERLKADRENVDTLKKRQRSRLIRSYLKYGYLDEAREANKVQYPVKRLTKLKISDVYTRDKFFYYITEYLIEPEKNRENEKDIKACFAYFFDEWLKGNKSIFEYDGSMENCVSDDEGLIIDMAFMWYKYFSGRDFPKMTAADIIKSVRYGIE